MPKEVKIKIVSLRGCKATPPTIDRTKEVANDMGVSIDLEHVIIKTQEEAIKHRHIGSPTIQINGVDIDPQARSINQFGIT